MFTTINYPEGHGRQFAMFRYPAGEVQVRLTPAQIKLVERAEKIQVIARITNGEVMELLQLINAIKGIQGSSGNQKIQLILPYLPYGRADRVFTPGDCFGLETFLNAIDSQIGFEDDIVTLDAHSKVGKDRYLSGFYDVSPLPLIETALACVQTDYRVGQTISTRKIGILFPDEGARKRYDLNNANRPNVFHQHSIFHASKKRKITTGELIGFAVPEKEAFEGIDAVLIIDDLCDGGGTFNGIADAMAGYGKELYLYVTHGIFSKGTVELLRRFRKIYTTDSFMTPHDSNYRAFESDGRVVILPCLGTILDAINTRGELYENALQNPNSSEPGDPVLPTGTETSGAEALPFDPTATIPGFYGLKP